LPSRQSRAFVWLTDGRGLAVLPEGFESFYCWEFTDEKSKPPAPGEVPPIAMQRAGDDAESLNYFAISPDGRWLAAGRYGQQARARDITSWEPSAGKNCSEMKREKNLGPQLGNCTGLEFTPDSKRLIVLSRETQAKEDRLVVWDLESAKEIKSLTVPVVAQQWFNAVLTLSPDGRWLALGCPDGAVRLVDL